MNSENTMEVKINYSGRFDELTSRWKQFKIIESLNQFEKDHRIWQRNDIKSFDIQCAFLGKTGYGKSTTINSIIGKNLFQSSSIESTTKHIQSVEWLINAEKKYYFSIADLPGIGESKKTDAKYFDLYFSIIDKTDCVVYILRADQRDYSIDEKILSHIKQSNVKFFIGLNYIDKIEPISRDLTNNLSHAQKINLKQKIKNLSDYFDICQTKIIPYCAIEKNGLELVVTAIINNIQCDY